MYVKVVSTRKAVKITEEPCGFEISSSQVSRLTAELDSELNQWQERPIDRTPYLPLDTHYEKIREGGRVVDCAVLMAVALARAASALSSAVATRSRRPKSTGGASSRPWSFEECMASASSRATIMRGFVRLSDPSLPHALAALSIFSFSKTPAPA